MEPITLTIILASASVLTSFIACTGSILAFRKKDSTNARQSEKTVDLTITDTCGEISHTMHIRCEIDDSTTSIKKDFTNVEENQVSMKIANIANQFANTANAVNDNTNPIFDAINTLNNPDARNTNNNPLQIQNNGPSSSANKRYSVFTTSPTSIFEADYNNTTGSPSKSTLDTIIQSARKISLDWYRFATLQNDDFDMETKMQWLPVSNTIPQNVNEIVNQRANLTTMQLVVDKMKNAAKAKTNTAQNLHVANPLHHNKEMTDDPSSSSSEAVVMHSSKHTLPVSSALPIVSLKKMAKSVVTSTGSLFSNADSDYQRVKDPDEIIGDNLDHQQLQSQASIINTTNIELSGTDNNRNEESD